VHVYEVILEQNVSKEIYVSCVSLWTLLIPRYHPEL
jgi:hypothetical protein